ncbi:hypothetical protein [Mangrovibacter yixingensis]|uniref:hypothetical protein n=1 Tax=Mangrovibacter yixingensis TaxID=1529639 RepID=UPI001CFB6D2B|nr:hypothetical protein [Mangrovibacter yixingensis]
MAYVSYPRCWLASSCWCCTAGSGLAKIYWQVSSLSSTAKPVVLPDMSLNKGLLVQLSDSCSQLCFQVAGG